MKVWEGHKFLHVPLIKVWRQLEKLFITQSFSKSIVHCFEQLMQIRIFLPYWIKSQNHFTCINNMYWICFIDWLKTGLLLVKHLHPGYYLQNLAGLSSMRRRRLFTVVSSLLSPVIHIISLIIIAVFQVKYQRQEIKYRYLDSKFGLHWRQITHYLAKSPEGANKIIYQMSWSVEINILILLPLSGPV